MDLEPRIVISGLVPRGPAGSSGISGIGLRPYLVDGGRGAGAPAARCDSLCFAGDVDIAHLDRPPGAVV